MMDSTTSRAGRTGRRLAKAAALAGALALNLTSPAPARAEDAPAAPAAAPAPAEVNVDQLLEQLMRVKPEDIKARLDGIKAESAKRREEAVKLRAQADALDAQAADADKRAGFVDQLLAGIAAAQAAQAATAAAPAPAADGKPMAAAAAPAAPAAPAAAEMKPEAKPEMKEAAMAPPAPAAKLVTYNDDVLPIFMAKCASCHNQDKAKGGLSLDVYDKMMAGGGSGVVVAAGASADSRLYRMVMHEEEPKMPLGGSKLDDASLAKIKAWIDGGALKDKTSKPVAKAKSAGAMEVAAAPQIAVEGELPMPLKQENIVYTPLQGSLAIRSMASSPVAPLVAVSGYRQVILYNSDTFEPLRALDFPEGTAESIRFSPNGSLIVIAGGEGGKMGVAAVYDVITGQRVGDYGKTFDTVLTADISLDHTQVAVGGSNKRVKVFDTATGNQIYEIDKHTDWITAVAFSPDGWFLATADRAGGLYVWQAETGRDVHMLRGHEGPINSIDYRADSQVLASAGADGQVFLFEMKDGQNIKKWAAQPQGALTVRFARDGRIVTSGVDQTTAVWDGDGKNLQKFPPVGDWAYAACFASGDKRVMAGSWKGEVKVWEVSDAKELSVIKISPQ